MSGDLESSGSSFGVETTRMIESIRRSKAEEIRIFLESCATVGQLKNEDDIKEQGGLVLVLTDDGYSKSEVNRRKLVQQWFASMIGSDILLETGFKSVEVIYQAARAVKTGLSPYDALEIFGKMTAYAAQNYNKKPVIEKDPNEEEEPQWGPLEGDYASETRALWSRALVVGRTKGFTDTQMVEWYASFLIEADKPTLEQFAQMVEQYGSAGEE